MFKEFHMSNMTLTEAFNFIIHSKDNLHNYSYALQAVMTIENQISNNPSQTDINNIDIKILKDQCINVLEKHTRVNTISSIEPLQWLNLRSRAAIQDNFYYALQIMPNSAIYKSRHGISKLELYGRKLTEESLEVFLSYAILANLKGFRIISEYTGSGQYNNIDYDDALTEHNLLDTLYAKFYNYFEKDNYSIEFFKTTAYRAICLYVIQQLHANNNDCPKMNNQAIKIINRTLKECHSELSLNDLGLTPKTYDEFCNGQISAKKAFAEASLLKLFEDSVLEKTDLLLPEKNSFHEDKIYFLTYGYDHSKIKLPAGYKKKIKKNSFWQELKLFFKYS